MIAGVAIALLAQLLSPMPRQDTAQPPAIVARAPLDTALPVNFRVLVSPDTVYVGQQTTYELGVFLDASVRDRLRRMEAIAPEMRGMMAYDPPAPSSGFPMRVAGTHRYEAHVYERALFPLTAGRIALPPARLVYAMPLSYSFFSREESYEVRSDSAIIIAVNPPLASRPPEWNGAVGSLTVSAHLDTAAARVGNPLVFTVVVRGHGNMKLLPRPTLRIPGVSAIATAERVALAPDSLDIRGEKAFDWVLTPLAPGRLVIPAVRYAYFDPDARRYDVATTPAIALSVAPGGLARLDTGVAAHPPLPVRSVYRGGLAREPYERSPFWWVMLLAPFPAAALAAARRPRRARAPRPPAQLLRTIARDGAARDARELRRIFLAASSARIRVPPLALAEPIALTAAARRAGVSTAVATSAAALLEALNAAAFDVTPPAPAAVAELARRAERVYEAIDREARTFRHGVSPARGVALIAVLALAAGTALHAASTNDDTAQFARGVSEYDHGRFALAAHDFAALATRIPRAADAWANLGTAALAAGDTGRAAAGWQRALRLEPLATDVRARLETLGSSTASGPGAVPPVPPLPLALAAALLWVGGWLFIARRIAVRRARSGLAAGGAALAVALVLGGATAALDGRLAARDLAVVATDTPLRLIPALAAEREGTVRMGEVVRVLERDGQWARVTADGRRTGWADADSLYSIARE